MSIQNRPNLHAVGLLTDIYACIDERMRGKFVRLMELPNPVMIEISERTVEFVESIDAILDRAAERT